MTNSRRLESFDLLRLFFVLLALASHFRISQGTGYSLQSIPSLQNQTASELPYLITITRSSMSALLILFGFMMEYVYANLWKIKGGTVVMEKLLTRTLICYLAFLAVASLAILSQDNWNIKTYLGTALFVYIEHPNAFLFKYYAFLIPIVFILMWVRFRFGWFKEMLLVVGLLLLAEGIKSHTSSFHSPFELLFKNFFGIGNEIGPSVIHSLILVIFGELTANYTINRKVDAKTWLWVSLVVLSAGAIVVEIHQIGFDQFVIFMASTKTYRAQNSPIYFAFGILGFLFFWSASWLVIRNLGHKARKWVSYYGGNTFIIFLYGNILLLFVPKVNPEGLAYPVTLVVCLLLSLACVNLYYWSSKNLKLVIIYNHFIRQLPSRFFGVVIGSPRFKPQTPQPEFTNQKGKTTPALKLKSKDKSPIDL